MYYATTGCTSGSVGATFNNFQVAAEHGQQGAPGTWNCTEATYTIHQGMAVYRAIAGVPINFNVGLNSVEGGVTSTLMG